METTEIRRGDFVYKDTLFVDLGPNKRHPRASTTDLKELLLPKRGTTPKDQVAHWYEAQLLHYGLPRSKDKNTAKVRLTNALSAKALSVPKEITQMETEMKKEFASALRKAKNVVGKPEQTKAKAVEKKATTVAKGTKTTIELEVDGVKVKIDRDMLDAAKKKSTKSKETSASGGASSKTKGDKASSSTPKPATAPKSKAVSAGASSKSPKGAKTSSSTPKPAAAAPKSPSKSKASPSAPRPLFTARRSQPFPRNTSARPVSDPPKHVYDHTPVSFHHDVEMDDAPPAYESLGFDEADDDETSERSSGPVQISGTYFIPNKPFFPFDLSLQIDHRQQKLWGRFNVGSKVGVLRADDITDITTGAAVSFGWRSEDEDDGNMRFGRGCDGYVEFDGEGWVQGRFRGLMHGDDVDFAGHLVNEDGLDVADMKHIWDEFPRKAYGRH
ncbi:uncharacterized protein Z520_12116 [Fonsecaea multimorphosa CBS 102226]|uniref:Uncharacterized protein n=1 Tax=Fonsecaea multimorphosa CBS 102226 TaxID=1442371 RepID=A0A0D2K6Z4_9EURO|nr:uncharacterized protein Z520_12116 [Fonsecaea multimorphosa CBS 102226]KIX92123.1 hypothetical protein Z520_12116 [Fonsecaea multimorphosa CBS 102226]OAL17549.1 hypothetical protein AYO22_11528 [Fonsecaea multimorphosa]